MNEGIEKVLITGYVAVNSHVKIEENDGSIQIRLLTTLNLIMESRTNMSPVFSVFKFNQFL